jgi:RHS repeat-associated protein
MSKAPAPDAGAASAPGVAVLGGGGAAGGDDANGKGGDDNADGKDGGNGKGANGDQKNAPNGQAKQGKEGEPVDVATGRVFTLPVTILALPGPLPLVLERQYSSSAVLRDVGLGFGWTHSLAWRVTTTRRLTQVWTEEGISVDFPLLRAGEEHLGPWGWLLRRDAGGYVLDKDDGRKWLFSGPPGEDGEWRLSAVEDRCGNRIALTYEAGRLTEVRDSVGRRVRLSRGAKGRVGAVEVLNAASQGRWVAFERYEYDEGGRLVTATDAEGYARTYAYEERSLLVRHTDRVGLSFHYVYDREGRCVETWGDRNGGPDPSLGEGLPEMLADGETRAKGIYHRKIDYMPNGYREVATPRQVRRYFTNGHGLVDKVVDAGRVVSATYDGRGFQASETDALGATTKYERDARGRLLAITDALGRHTAFDRDTHGDVVRVTEPAGGVRTFERDKTGNVVIATNAIGAITSMEYDARGLLSAVRNPMGGVLRLARDAHGNMTGVVQPNGRTWQYQYDFLGRVLAEIDPAGSVRRYRYSARGDLAGAAAPDGAVASFQHDGEHHLLAQVDPSGTRFTLRWGGLGKLIERVDANGHTTRMRYDHEGDLLDVENQRGEHHRLAYDMLGNLCEETTFDGRRIRYKGDAMGRIVSVESGAHDFRALSYDAVGNLVGITLGDGTVQTFERDVLGNVVRVVWPEGECRFERDALGRVVGEVQRHGTEADEVAIEYSLDGRRVARSTSRGHHLRIDRDPDGIPMRSVYDDEIVEHTNDAIGREIVRGLAGGGRIESEYDARGHLTRRRARRPGDVVPGRGVEPEWIGPRDIGVTVEKTYHHDAVGRLLETHDSRHGVTQYQYDPAGRLLAALKEDGSGERFSYDPAGNLTRDASGGDAHHGPDGRLVRSGPREYTWNDEGRLATKRERTAEGERLWRYRWNAQGLLAGVTCPDGSVVEFSYDPLARRTAKRVLRPQGDVGVLQEASRTRFVWDQDVLVHEIRKRAGADGDPVVEERTYVFSDEGFRPEAHRDTRRDSASKECTGWHHYLHDPIGTPERLIASDGEIAAELNRKVWGETRTAPATTTTPFRFLGQYEDEETGLCYNRYRYYDPETGKFISPDPIGIEGGLNIYARGADPLQYIDALGLAGRYPLDIVWTPSSWLTPDERAIQKDVKEARKVYPPGKKKCRQLAQEFADKDPNNRKTVQMLPLGEAQNLDPKKGVLPPGIDGWGSHSATELRDGRVVDVDRGIIFQNRE